MQDFGEALADIRDRLEGPLPIRVSQTRVFLVSALVMFGFLAVCARRVPPPSDMGLPDFRGEDDYVFQQFKDLTGIPCNSMQVEQARELFSQLMQQRHARNACEWCLWRNAVQAGMFLAGLTMALLVVSGLLAIATDHQFANMVVLSSFIVISVVAGIVCRVVYLNEWVLITGMAAAIAGFVLIWLAFIGENTVMATVGGMLFGGGVVFGIFQH